MGQRRQKKTIHKKSKNKSRHQKRKTRRLRKRQVRGGKAFATGAYGCVFKPELACADKRPRGNGVSKVMEARHAEAEMAEMENIRKFIKHIPNNANYFLIGNTYMCEPDALQNTDLENFNKVCQDSLVDRGYTEANINNNLHKVRLINIPYGGLELDEYWRRTMAGDDSDDLFTKLNQKLVDLLKNAIVPMNLEGLNHNDLKGDNILVDEQETGKFKCRMIDWGLASTMSAKLPDELIDYPLTFNRPFAHILFRSKPIIVTSGKSLKDFAKSYLKEEITANEGHYKAITARNIPSLHLPSEPDDIIVEHLTTVLEAYVDPVTKTFNANRYFKEVYQKNADLWGFIMCYHDLTTESKTGPLWDDTPSYLPGLKEIYLTYCYSPTYAARPMPVDRLVQAFKNLN
jgi:hypothetical protein